MKEIKKGFTAREQFEAMLQRYIKEDRKKNIKVVAETEHYILLAAKGKCINLSIVTGDTGDRMLPDVYIEQDYEGTCKIAQINWSAYGSCTVEETKAFTKNLQEAIEFVNQINGKDFSKVFDN